MVPFGCDFCLLFFAAKHQALGLTFAASYKANNAA
jgi:hypothetical protein